MRILIIDNYDSFTFNLYQYVGEILLEQAYSSIKPDVIVKRNDELTINDIYELNPDRIIISPGSGSPDNESFFGICSKVILELGQTIPILGVCLGMQGIAHCFGGQIIRAPTPMHGKTSCIIHNNQGVFNELPQQLEIMRYHSLIVDPLSFPECLEITATISDDINDHFINHHKINNEIMGLKHKTYPIQGVQFHPESFATEGAKKLILNFINQT